MSNKPAKQTATNPPLEYRILCNSEHFIVLNPGRRTKPQKTVHVDKAQKRTGPVILKAEQKEKTAENQG